MVPVSVGIALQRQSSRPGCIERLDEIGRGLLRQYRRVQGPIPDGISTRIVSHRAGALWARLSRGFYYFQSRSSVF